VHHIIINPTAGRGYSLTILPELTNLFDSFKLPYEVLPTKAPQEARAFAEAVCRKGSDGIVGMGGDGTIQEIVAGMADAFSGMAEFPTPLGILPCGSGNDFVLTLNGRGGKKNNDVASLFYGIQHNVTRSVDVIIDTSGGAFINIANMGLDALIVQNAEPLRKTFGQNAYLAAAVKSIARHKNVRLTVTADGNKIQGSFTLIAICNGQYYGGGMRIAPSALLDDGRITLVLAEAMSRPKLMLLFPSIIFQKHTKLKEVRTLTCREVLLEWEGEATLCLDGNLYSRTGAAGFKVAEKALRLYV
jgi:YegS/Rv2252/BmrU family lipid kinase